MPISSPIHRQPPSPGPRLLYPEPGRQARRALNTNSKAWKAIRARILKRDLYVCQVCNGFGNEVDHKDGNDANQADSNLWVLCRPCHSERTAKHDGGFGNTVNRRTQPSNE